MGIEMPPPDWVAMWTGVGLLSVVVMLVGAWLIRKAIDSTPTYRPPVAREWDERHEGRRSR